MTYGVSSTRAKSEELFCEKRDLDSMPFSRTIFYIVVSFVLSMSVVFLSCHVISNRIWVYHPLFFMDFPFFHGLLLVACILVFLLAPRTIKKVDAMILIVVLIQIIVTLWEWVILIKTRSMPQVAWWIYEPLMLLKGNVTHFRLLGGVIFPLFHFPPMVQFPLNDQNVCFVIRYTLCVQLPIALYHSSKIFMFVYVLTYFLLSNFKRKTVALLISLIILFHSIFIGVLFRLVLKPFGLFFKKGGFIMSYSPLAPYVYISLFVLIIVIHITAGLLIREKIVHKRSCGTNIHTCSIDEIIEAP